jgi:hypothetical protein
MPYGERRSSRGVGGMMQERIEGLVLLRGAVGDVRHRDDCGVCTT